MPTARINQGESLTIALVFQQERVSQIQNIAISVGNMIVGTTQNQVIKADSQIPNHFLCCISSYTTQKICPGIHDVVVAVDWTDMGVRKSNNKGSAKLQVSESTNNFSNNAVSGNPTLQISISFVEDVIETEVVLGTLIRGMNALEMFRAEYNLPTATLDQMMYFYSPTKAKAVVNVQDGTIIELPAGISGHVATEFWEQDGQNYRKKDGFYTEYSDNTHIIFKTPIFDDLLNRTFTGVLLCTKLA